ncbi:BREX-3 system P-loop-containing protein BrxF [Fusobacterium ulcerans]|uniref:BREX-3 system P-loop-containing protein BrxF n=1 Tax=Fusobacterium ulcerans TaxID=861 RepID=UPI002672D102|nr:BREX-3 system P-loop-containing protein BrxF [Fusobacterium ulcerans]
MVKLSKLLEENSKAYYRMLTLIGDESSEKERIQTIETYLGNKEWKIYDVEDIVMDIKNRVDEEELSFVIGDEIKSWVFKEETGHKILLKNANILYSKELSAPQPFATFKYLTRNGKEIILILDAKMVGRNKAIYATPNNEEFATIDFSEVVHEELKNVVVE